MEQTMDFIAFPQYVLEKTLKASSNGCVYLVRNTESRVRYIYRVFKGNADVYRRLLGICCPYLPMIHEVKEENGIVYVLEEYIQGDTLAFLLEGKPLTASHAKQIIAQLCNALEILHGIGAVHRDIKPENIIIRGSDAVLIDFDASRLCKSDTSSDTRVMGTTGYAAPEQYGFAQTDARTDIYALGILLNEMITKRHPSNFLAEGEYRPIIQKCTQINADQRYTSVAELRDAFELPSSGRKDKIRNFLLIMLAGVALLCGGLLYRAANMEKLPAEAGNAAAGSEETDDEAEAIAPETEEISDQAQETEEVVISQEPSYSSPEIDVFVPEQLEISMEPWEGNTDGHSTQFKCDMDGDGKMENYLFGVDYINSPHENVVYYDRNMPIPDLEVRRDVHPCVWRVFDDGTMEVVTGFAELLTDAYVRVWRVDDFTSPEPEAWTMAYTWPGCVSVDFYPIRDGMWLYEIGANLGENQLTASATTSFYFE